MTTTMTAAAIPKPHFADLVPARPIESIYDVGWAEAWPDVADLRQEGTGQTSQAGTKGEGQHIYASGADAKAGRHAAILHHGTDQQTERGLCEEKPCRENDHGRKADDKDAIVAKTYVVDGEMSEEPGGGIDLNIVGAENHAEALLHDQRNTPGGKQ